MSDKNKNGEGEKKGLTNKIIGGVILLIALALIIFVRPNADKAPTAEENTPEESEGVLQVAQQVVSGDYTYEFQGVKWIFDTESAEVAGTGQTWLKMEFADFTRNGNAISFGRPYKLGVHPGTCANSDFVDTTDVAGIPLGYAVCEGSGVKREFVALQEIENVTVKMRETKGDVVSEWKDWYKIDVTEIVR